MVRSALQVRPGLSALLHEAKCNFFNHFKFLYDILLAVQVEMLRNSIMLWQRLGTWPFEFFLIYLGAKVRDILDEKYESSMV